MTNNARPETPALTSKPSIRFVKLTSATLTALLSKNVDEASLEVGVPLTAYFVTDEALRRWRRRLDQITATPEDARWIAQVAVAEPEGIVIGHAGFHSAPDEAGMVEVAYSVDPGFRRQGYARAMLRALLHRAMVEPDVKTVRATIRPDNAASLATIAGFDFTEVGEQWDDVDGLEIIFEVSSIDISREL